MAAVYQQQTAHAVYEEQIVESTSSLVQRSDAEDNQPAGSHAQAEASNLSAAASTAEEGDPNEYIPAVELLFGFCLPAFLLVLFLRWITNYKILHIFPFHLWVFGAGMLAQGIVVWTKPYGYISPNAYDLTDADFANVPSFVQEGQEAATSFIQNSEEGGHEAPPFGLLLWRAWHRAGIISDHLIFLALLPPSLMEDALSIKRYALKNVYGSSILLATIGVIIQTFLGGALIYAFCWNMFEDSHFQEVRDAPGVTGQHEATMTQWYISFLIAAVLTAIDPVAMIHAFNGAPESLLALIACQALLNDGAAFCFYALWRDAAGEDQKHSMCPTTDPSGSLALCQIAQFCKFALGGIGFGKAMAIVGLPILSLMSFAANEIIALYALVYATMFYGELYLDVSGVVAVVVLCFSFTLRNQSGMSREGFHTAHKFVEQIAWLANQIIWLIAGMVCCRMLVSHHDTAVSLEALSWSSMFRDIFIVYIIISFTRFCAVFLFWPVLRVLGFGRSQGISFEEIILMSFGGVRGIVCCAMMLGIESSTIHKANKFRINGIIAGNIILCLVINQVFLPFLYKYLDPHPWDKASSVHDLAIFTDVEETDWWQIVMDVQRSWRYKRCQPDIILKAMPNYTFLVFGKRGKLKLALNPVEVRDVMHHIYALHHHKHNHGDITTRNLIRHGANSGRAEFFPRRLSASLDDAQFSFNDSSFRSKSKIIMDKKTSESYFYALRSAKHNVAHSCPSKPKHVSDTACKHISQWADKLLGKRHFIASTQAGKESGVFSVNSAQPLSLLNTKKRFLFKVNEHRSTHNIIGITTKRSRKGDDTSRSRATFSSTSRFTFFGESAATLLDGNGRPNTPHASSSNAPASCTGSASNVGSVGYPSTPDIYENRVCAVCPEERQCGSIPGASDGSVGFLVGHDQLVHCASTLEEIRPMPLTDHVVFMRVSETPDGFVDIEIESKGKMYKSTIYKKLSELYLTVMQYTPTKFRIGALPPVALGLHDHEAASSARASDASFEGNAPAGAAHGHGVPQKTLRRQDTNLLNLGMSSGIIVNWTPQRESLDDKRSRYMIFFHYLNSHYDHAYHHHEINGFIARDLKDSTEAAMDHSKNLIKRDAFIWHQKGIHNFNTEEHMLNFCGEQSKKFNRQTEKLRKLMHTDAVSEELFPLHAIDPFHYEYAHLLKMVNSQLKLVELYMKMPSCLAWPFMGWAYRRLQTLVAIIHHYVDAHQSLLDHHPLIQLYPVYKITIRKLIADARNVTLVAVEQSFPQVWMNTALNGLLLQNLLSAKHRLLEHTKEHGTLREESINHLCEALRDLSKDVDEWNPLQIYVDRIWSRTKRVLTCGFGGNDADDDLSDYDSDEEDQQDLLRHDLRHPSSHLETETDEIVLGGQRVTHLARLSNPHGSSGRGSEPRHNRLSLLPDTTPRVSLRSRRSSPSRPSSKRPSSGADQPDLKSVSFSLRDQRNKKLSRQDSPV